MLSAQPSQGFLIISTQCFQLQCRLQSSTRTSRSTHRHLLHQPFDFLGNWCQRGRRSFGVLGSRGSSWTSYGDHSFSASACLSCFICVLHELGLRLVFGFEHLVCNVWWTMLVCVTLIYLCSSCGCEVVLTMLKFISYILYLVCLDFHL